MKQISLFPAVLPTHLLWCALRSVAVWTQPLPEGQAYPAAGRVVAAVSVVIHESIYVCIVVVSTVGVLVLGSVLVIAAISVVILVSICVVHDCS